MTMVRTLIPKYPLLPIFSKQNDLQHIITMCCHESSKASPANGANAQIEFITSHNSEANAEFAYRVLPTSLTLGDAIEKGHIEGYGRILIRIFSDENESL